MKKQQTFKHLENAMDMQTFLWDLKALDKCDKNGACHWSCGACPMFDKGKIDKEKIGVNEFWILTEPYCNYDETLGKLENEEQIEFLEGGEL